MSNQPLQHETNGGFEREDLGAKPVFGFLIGLAVVVALSYVVEIGRAHV